MKHYLLAHLLLISLFASAQSTLETDRLALVALYTSTNGGNWLNKTGWDVPGSPGDNPCGWFGVTCNDIETRITGLNMVSNQLSGSLPTEIGKLSELTVLNLNGNDADFLERITGEIPVQLGQLTNLIHLDLGGNNFTSLIPSSLGNLVKLEYLNLSYDPEDVAFDPYGNITGSIPTEIGNLINLKYLDISRQNLSGALPASIGSLASLEYLNLGFNQFAGSIPVSYGTLINLEFLNLEYSGYLRTSEYGGLTGAIPDFSALPATAKIYIANQSFTFDGMLDNISRLASYSPQNLILLQHMEAFPTPYIIWADAGAKPQPSLPYDYNYVYKVFRNGTLDQTQEGEDRFFVEDDANYSMEITNKLLPGLILYTNVVYLPVSMPVKLISFSAENVDHVNLLHWKTVSETNNSGFEVERSLDAKIFETIGFVDGGGNSQKMKEYHFSDMHPHALTYYRLKQIDFDGKSEYSTMISVKSKQASLSVYPNPVVERLSVKNLGTEEMVIVRNSTGGVVLRQIVKPDVPLNTEKLSNGLYTITIGAETRKFLIQK